MKRISILGCGWFGLALAKKLIAKGYQVKASTTSEWKLEQLKNFHLHPYLINISPSAGYDADFFDTDILIIAIPPSAFNTSELTYAQGISHICLFAANLVKKIIFISSTGVFSDNQAMADENTVPLPDTETGKKLYAAELAFLNQAIPSKCIIRFGGLIGEGRNLTKYFAGKTDLKNGSSPINLIALDDCIGLMFAILANKNAQGIFHGVCPHHPSRKEFYTALCKAAKLDTPYFKQELSSNSKLIQSNISAEKLAYTYKVTNWFQWIESSNIF